jgi:hypothetical protein
MYVGLAVALYYGVTYLWNAGRTYFAGRTALADPPLFFALVLILCVRFLILLRFRTNWGIRDTVYVNKE